MLYYQLREILGMKLPLSQTPVVGVNSLRSLDDFSTEFIPYSLR